jgi:hypothetical protein
MGIYNSNQKGAIETLVIAGFDIIEIQTDENERELYVTTVFEKPSTGSISSSPYFRIRGWEITNLIESIAGGNMASLIAQVKLAQEKKQKSLEFSEKYIWRYYPSN